MDFIKGKRTRPGKNRSGLFLCGRGLCSGSGEEDEQSESTDRDTNGVRGREGSGMEEHKGTR